MPKDRPDSPDVVQISRKFIDALSNIRDTLVRYDLARMRARPEALQVELAGSSDECRERFVLAEGRTAIGRGETCGVQIEVGHVSRLHATILVQGGEVTVKDEGSSNGTYVNGARVTEARLSDGDIVHFGPLLRFVVVIRRPVVPASPAPAARPDDVALARTELPDERPGAPPPSATMELLDRERRQLAILLQIAMRYLSADATEDPLDVLFEVLPRVVQLDAAFVALPRGGELEFYPYPGGVALSHDDCARLAGECDAHPVVHDSAVDGLALEGMRVASRALLPLEDGGCLAVLGATPDLYAHQLDFLVILSQIHARASRRR